MEGVGSYGSAPGSAGTGETPLGHAISVDTYFSSLLTKSDPRYLSIREESGDCDEDDPDEATPRPDSDLYPTEMDDDVDMFDIRDYLGSLAVVDVSEEDDEDESCGSAYVLQLSLPEEDECPESIAA